MLSWLVPEWSVYETHAFNRPVTSLSLVCLFQYDMVKKLY